MADDSIKNASFVSLGFPKNLVDSEAMLGDLASAGYRLVSHKHIDQFYSPDH